MERPAEVVAGGDRRVGACHVCPREVNRVLGRLEQRHRPPEAVERRERLRLLERQPPERPVEPYPRVPVGAVAAACEELRDDRLGALELSKVGQRVAQVGAVADASVHVLRLHERDLVECALEQRHRLPRRPRGGIRPAERREDIRPRRSGHELRPHDRGELLDRPRVISARRRLEPEHDPGARRRSDVGRDVGVLQQFEHCLRIRLALEAQSQLLLGEPQLPQLGRVELGARLEVLGRDAELLRQHPERLHRRRPRPGLDPGDVRVGDSRCREVPLGPPALDPQSAQAGADRLPTRVPGLRHRAIVPASFDNVNRAMPQDDRIDNKRILRSPPGVGSCVRRGRRC